MKPNIRAKAHIDKDNGSVNIQLNTGPIIPLLKLGFKAAKKVYPLITKRRTKLRLVKRPK